MTRPTKPQWIGSPIWYTTFTSYSKTSHAAGHHRLAFDRAARRTDPDHVAALNLFLPGQRFWNLDEEMRLQLATGRDVLGPVVKMLGQTIGGPDVGIILRRAERVEVAAEDLAAGLDPTFG